jgi:GxxExxY protein
MTLSRAQSNLPEELEELIHTCIGVFIAVHRELSCGMSEKVYASASHLELNERGISFESEKTFPVRYRGKFLCHQRVDLLIESCLVVELKAVDALHEVHRAQLLTYMRLCGVRAGLLINFNVPVLKQGIKRVVL